MKPQEIEYSSMDIIESELKEKGLFDAIDSNHLDIVKRTIHTSADFDFAKNLVFTEHAVKNGLEALQESKAIITDTNMIIAGISKPATSQLGNELVCYVADPDVKKEAKDRGVTRSTVAMEKALKEHPGSIVAVGNAPTALIALEKTIKEGAPKPALVIAVPVGFVNVVESKNLIENLDIESIVARGRKGGSTIAVAILNALLYRLYERD